MGFVEGFIELESQMAALGLHADYLFHATGSGGTLAGLQAARALLGSDTEIISINVNKKGPDYLDDIVLLANGTLSLLGAPDGLRVQREDLHIDPGYYLPGYEQPNEASNEAIRILARKEGLVVTLFTPERDLPECWTICTPEKFQRAARQYSSTPEALRLCSRKRSFWGIC